MTPVSIDPARKTAPALLSISDLWRLDGSVGRATYAIWGTILFALKHNLDRFAAAIFERPWGPLNYMVVPGENLRIHELRGEEARFLATLAAIALPFIFVGTALTLRRLRDSGLSRALVLLFFVPVVNLIFFAVLAAIPKRPAEALAPPASGARIFFERLIPVSQVGSAALALVLTVPPFAGVAALGASLLGQYGWGLFVALPFSLGLTSVLIYGYHGQRSFGHCLAVSQLAIALLGAALFAFCVEGIVCLAMAVPIGAGLAAMGALVGYALQIRPAGARDVTRLLSVLLIAAPLLIGAAERASPPESPLFEVTTAVEVEAPPERVYENVIGFAELPPPDDWVLRTGIAYPVRAEILGRGPGAVRRCIFTTGAFVEPIEVDDPPRVLRFSVSEQPPALREWSWRPGVSAPHVSDYLVSTGGQFKLTALDHGRTRLEGTTWYRHRIWPAAYWRLFSDAILHRIHRRVLEHVKRLSEASRG